jgi:tetratricopeptide (TPR) repeat protein
VLFLCVLVLGREDVHAQTPAVIGQLAARQHLDHAPAPTYPMIAMAAKVTGVVSLDVTIAPDGRVLRSLALAGPPMLLAAAERGVAEWRFHPIVAVGGEAVTARTLITVLYGPQPAQPAIDALITYGDAMMLCAVGVETRRFEAVLPHCARSVEAVAALPRGLWQGPHARILHSLALAGAGRYDEALESLSRTEREHPKLGWSATDEALGHLVRARVELGRGKPQDAAGRFEDAYNTFDQTRRRIPRDSPLRGYVIEHQQRIGPEWAGVLDQLGRQRDAERVRGRVKELR